MQKALHSRAAAAAADIAALLRKRSLDGLSSVVHAPADIKALAGLLKKHASVVAGDQPSSSYSESALVESASLLPLLAKILPDGEHLSGQDKAKIASTLASAVAHVLLVLLSGRQAVPAAQRPEVDASLVVRCFSTGQDGSGWQC